MGQALKKFASGSEEKAKIDEIIQNCYEENYGTQRMFEENYGMPEEKYGTKWKSEMDYGPAPSKNFDTTCAAEYNPNLTRFYRVICEIVEKINENFRHTQFRLPDDATLEKAYSKLRRVENRALSREEFQEIIEQVIKGSAGLTGFGAKGTVLYMFGVPAAALFVKQRVAPKALPNDVFIPLVTSATVYLLAKLNKL